MPLLATYYYGATTDKESLTPIISYLEQVGERGINEKWRWLSQAVYLARFRQGNQERALELAYKLAEIEEEGMPGWTKQMPAFIMLEQNEKEAALGIMLALIQDRGDDLHPNEIYFMVDYICTRLLPEKEAAVYPLCTSLQ